MASSIDLSASSSSVLQPRDEPGGAPRAHEPEHAFRFWGQLEADPASVAAGSCRSANEAGPNESRDVPRHRGRRDAFLRSELANAHAGRATDRDEQRDLASRHSQRVHFAAELAGELQQDRAQPVGDGKWIGGDRCRGQFVNQVNNSRGCRVGLTSVPLSCVVATITRPQKSLVLILARGVAANLSVPISVLDAEGNLVFFNEAAEEMHGITFDDAGELSAAEWPNVFSINVPLEELPVGVALFERRAVHTTLQFTGADGISREVSVTAFPLMGREEEVQGAIAIFWQR